MDRKLVIKLLAALLGALTAVLGHVLWARTDRATLSVFNRAGGSH